MQEIRTGPVLV